MKQVNVRFTFEVINSDDEHSNENGLPLHFDVLEFTLQEQLNQPYHLEVDLISHNASADFNQIIDKPALFTIWQGEKAVRHIHGLISEFEQKETGHRRTRYKAIVEPSLSRLTLTSDWRIFQEQAANTILESILKANRINNYEVNSQLEHMAREYCVQAGELDINFFNYLSAQEGYVYRIESNNQTDRLLLTDIIQTFGSMQEPVLYNANPGGDKQKPSIRSLAYKRRVRTASKTSRDYTFKNPRYSLEHQSHGKNLSGQKTHYERYTYPNQYKKDAVGKPFTHTQIQSLRNDAHVATILGDDARLQPGIAFELSGHQRTDFNTYWRPVKITHKGKQHTAAEEDAATASSSTFYEHSAELVLATEDWKATIPAEHKIEGPLIGHIVGPGGEEIYTDNFGRVKVQFPWDRNGTGNENSSCWIRVAQNWAGAGWGHMAIPRIGQEVIVSFLGGDQDQPIVIGRTYDANHPTPYKLPALKTQQTTKSKEHKGSGYNELLIDDTTGEIKTQLHTTHQTTQLTLGHLTHPRKDDGSGEHRGDGFELRTDTHGAIRAGKGIYISADKRDKAQGKQLDLQEAITQLEMAIEIAKELANASNTAQAIPTDTSTQEEQLRQVYTDLQKAGILTSSPEGIATVTPQSIQHSAGENITLTTGQSTDISAQENIRAVAGESVSLLAVKETMKLIANQGEMKIQAQNNQMEIAAQKGLKILSTDDKLIVAAAEEILLTSGGAYIKLKGGNIELHAPGIIDHKAAAYPFAGPTSMEYNFLDYDAYGPELNDEMFVLKDRAGKPIPNFKYKIVREDGKEFYGVTNGQGETIRVYTGRDKLGLTLYEDDGSAPNASAPEEAPSAGTSQTSAITSRTVAPQISNKTRTRIGAGEEVDLTVKTGGAATWSASPAGLVKLPADAGSTASTFIRIKALDKAGTATITAKNASSTSSITLTVVLPQSISMERIPGTPLMHKQGHPSCGWFGRPVITPSDVSFSNVHIRELDDQFVNTGIYAFYSGAYHGTYSGPDKASGWFLLNAYDPSKGSFAQGAQDRIWSGNNTLVASTNPSPPPPFREGRVYTPIRWQWTIDTTGSTHHNFPAFDQVAVADGNGACTMSKGGHSETSQVNDPTTGGV